MGLILGKLYWILTDLEHPYVLGEREFNALKLCVLQHYATIDHETIKYYFHRCDENGELDDIMNNCYEMCDWECEQLVFYSIDEYLHYLVRHVDNLNTNITDLEFTGINIGYSFDDFLKQKILESQEKHPEIWI